MTPGNQRLYSPKRCQFQAGFARNMREESWQTLWPLLKTKRPFRFIRRLGESKVVVPTFPWAYQPFEGARLVVSQSQPITHEPCYHKIAVLREPVVLQRGGTLPQVEIAYETYGRLSADKDNCILVCHALTGDSHAAKHDRSDPRPGWWERMIGPGKPLDTDRYFVVCQNVLGGCSGSTGPASVNPRTQKKYAGSFPEITVTDMVNVQHSLLQTLGIRRIHTVIGGSMGGMQALLWCTNHPEAVRKAVVIAAPGRIRAQAVAFNEVQRQAITKDPGYEGGCYSDDGGPVQGLATARMLGMITYQSEESMERKFRQKTPMSSESCDEMSVREYLRYQGDKLVKRFDANSYLCLLRALDLFSLSENGETFGALRRVCADVLVLGIKSDILYPTHQQRELVDALRAVGARAQYSEIDSSLGHDAFLLEFERFAPLIRDFVG